MSDLAHVVYTKTTSWGEDRHPLVTVTCPHNCGWKVRLHKQHVSFNLAGHLEDKHCICGEINARNCSVHQ